MDTSVRPLLRLRFVVAAAALVSAACGSTASNGTTSATDTPTTAQAETAQPAPKPLPVDAPSTIVGHGTSFGECGGYCITELDVSGELITLRQQSFDGGPDRTTSGTLTIDGQNALAAVSSNVSGTSLDEIYGCPDCADGGAEYVVIAASDQSTTTVSFEYANGPDELANASELLRVITQGLTNCVSNEYIDVGGDCKKANVDPAQSPAGDERSEFIGGGTSFGMCFGYCGNEIRFNGDMVVLTSTSWNEDERPVTNFGTLTPAGVDLLVAAREAVENRVLEEVYGCPDCVDGGAEYYDFIYPEASDTRSTFQYNEPPTNTAAASLIIQQAIETLGTCISSDLVTVAEDCVGDPKSAVTRQSRNISIVPFRWFPTFRH